MKRKKLVRDPCRIVKLVVYLNKICTLIIMKKDAKRERKKERETSVISPEEGTMSYEFFYC